MTSTYNVDKEQVFKKLENFLEGRNSEVIYASNAVSPSFMNLGVKDTTVDLYKFDNGFEIIREKEVDRNERSSIRSSGSRQFVGRDFGVGGYTTTTNRYYFIDKGSVIEDLDLAVKLVEESTGIKLSRMSKVEGYNFSGDVIYEICTQIPRYSEGEDEHYNYSCQPNDEELKSDATRTLENIKKGESSPNDFGLTFDQFIYLANQLKANAKKIAEKSE